MVALALGSALAWGLAGCSWLQPGDGGSRGDGGSPGASAGPGAAESDGAAGAYGDDGSGGAGGSGSDEGAQAVDDAASDDADPQAGPLGDHQSVVDAACGDDPSGTDLGPRVGARGTVEASDAKGRATMYTVAGGDSYKAIVERFCLDSQEFATINAITNIGQVYQGDVYAFTGDAAVDARRASGLDFAACPRGAYGYPALASIAWTPVSDTRAKATGIGTPVDTGAAGTAQGEARTDASGDLVDYVVASGDTWRGIEDRFCMDYYYVASLTGQWLGYPMIHPGDVIPLQPRHLEITVG